ncbi:hypothetical protein CFC21_028777 [Triticum aestivum]|uniref:CASP-like protein n=2 Tax=Triticum aestivum TaxID=4565 RepID=A0A9R1ERX8_WHEAT|nr:hypothetical protein CFC21_028777 [Triticum aestivum]
MGPELALGIEGGELPPGSGMEGRWPVERLVCFIGFTTACMATSVAVYTLPTGIFDDHKLAYYVSVASAGFVGFAEVFAAVTWMSGSAGVGDDHPRSQARRCVLCASLLPLAFLAGLGGVRILVK